MTTGATVVLPLLSPFPKVMLPVQARLEELGYVFLDCFIEKTASEAKLHEDTALALAPLPRDANKDLILAVSNQLKLKYPNLHVVAVTNRVGTIPQPELIKTGAEEAFNTPFEDEMLINKFFEHSPIRNSAHNLTLDQLMRVNILEMERAKKLDFDIFLYLPLNRKTILYVEQGHALDEKMVKKFKDHAHYGLYIRRADIKSYLEFCGRIIQDEGDYTLSDTERDRKVGERVAKLMSGFFNDKDVTEDEAKVLFENMKSIVNELEDRTFPKKKMTVEVMRFCSQRLTHYTHAQNVAAYSAMFGMMLGYNEPQTLRMGGILHDLGLADLPSELLGQDVESMNDEDAAKYKLHPGGGKYTVEQNKMEIPREAIEMILYHHERPDGSGYPYGKRGSEIPPFAKICALADEFDKLTSVRTGHAQLSPGEAMRRIAGLDGEPAMSVFDPTFHQPIINHFVADLQAGMPPELIKVEPAPESQGAVVQSHLAKDLPAATGPDVTRVAGGESVSATLPEVTKVAASEANPTDGMPVVVSVPAANATGSSKEGPSVISGASVKGGPTTATQGDSPADAAGAAEAAIKPAGQASTEVSGQAPGQVAIQNKEDNVEVPGGIKFGDLLTLPEYKKFQLKPIALKMSDPMLQETFNDLEKQLDNHFIDQLNKQ